MIVKSIGHFFSSFPCVLFEKSQSDIWDGNHTNKCIYNTSNLFKNFLQEDNLFFGMSNGMV